ncbi:MAG: DUF4118 domain-containing protein, partial [Gammaproteobacteria bacterium]|nr:DUF4118 domain-containing protein [Gammaproteobacteria bacterium]
GFSARLGPRIGQQLGLLLAVLAISLLLAFLLRELMPHASLSLVFLTGVLVVASRTGLGPALLASLLSFLAFNFFFTRPYYTFKVADDADVATLGFFLLTAAITGNLAARIYQESGRRQLALARLSNLHECSRQMVSTTSGEQVLQALAEHLHRSMALPVAVFAADGRLVAALADGDNASAAESFALGSGERPAGLAQVQGPLDADLADLARSLCDQASLALERIQLVADLDQARVQNEAEQLRSALLSSVSHDLRTPLASIIGSTTSLLDYAEAISPADRQALLATVVAEARRLDRHIQNLLDMARIGQGELVLQRQWVDLQDLIAEAKSRLQAVLAGVRLELDIAADFPLLWVQETLITQVLVNLLDNAIRFSPTEGSILLRAWVEGESLCIELCDQGPGIPAEAREAVFLPFHTLMPNHPRDRCQRTGLGLAICRGLIEAHAGQISAHGGLDGRGACLRIVLPRIPYQGKP